MDGNGRRPATCPEILLLGSLPLSRPWNGADKVLARTIVTADAAHRYVVQTGPDDQWPDHVLPVREGRPPAMPGPRALAGAGRYLLRTMGRADVVHLVATMRDTAPVTTRGLRAWRAFDRRPLVHTLPGIALREIRRRHIVGDVTVTFSEHTAARLRDAGANDVVTMFPPMPLADLVPGEPAEAVRARYGLGDRPILYSAHAGPGSGMVEMIEALARLPAGASHPCLALCLRGRSGHDLRREVDRLQGVAGRLGVADRVRIITHVTDMTALIAACELTVLVPRELDGKMDLPLVLLESLALGRAIVVADTPPIREALLGGGVEVPFGDPDALAAAVSRLLEDDDLRERLARTGRKRVRQLADPGRAAAAYARIYERAAGIRAAATELA